MKNPLKSPSLLSFAVASNVLMSQPLLAEQGTSFMLEEIVVTAQKREESLQDVPIALSAFSDSFIKQTKITDAKQLVRFTPGLSGESKDSFVDQLSVRGISTNAFGIGGDSSVGIYKDGVYFGRNGAAVTSFFDIERVEVLKGPQGLLFGRNAASGAIHTITAKPSTEAPEGYFRLGGGERHRAQAEFSYNQPLNEQWAFRIAAIHSEEDGYVKNLYNNKDLIDHNRQAVRLSLKHEADWGEVTLIAEHEDRRQSGTIYIARDENGNPITGDERQAFTDWPDQDDAKVSSLTLNAVIDLSDSLTLTSITGYNKHDWLYREDFDGSPVPMARYTQDQNGEYYSQELRLNGDNGDGLKWYIGASAYEEDVSADFTNTTGDLSDVFGSPVPVVFDEANDTRGDYSGWGVYGDVTLQLTEKMDMSIGARYTYDKKDMTIFTQGQGFIWGINTPQPVSSEEDWNNFSPRVTLRYFTDNDWMLFASVSDGYKSGGFGTDGVTAFDPATLQPLPGATLASFDPETLRSYEIGAKGELADGKVQLGISSYFYDYEDLQQTTIDFGKLQVENLGQVDGYGVELDLKAMLNEHWSLFLGAAWAKTKANDIPLEICSTPSGSCNGNRLPYNPEWNVSGGITGTLAFDSGELTGGLDFSWQSEIYSDLANQNADRVDSAGFVNLRAGWSSHDNWSLNFYVENLFDKESIDGTNTGQVNVIYGPSFPRTAGIDFSYNFSL